MAKTTTKVAGFVAALLTVPGVAQVEANPEDALTFVVHVRDYQGVPDKELSKAQAEVSGVYARAGVQIEWTDGSAALVADGRIHVDLLILTRQMADRAEPDGTVLGRGSHGTKRAAVFYSRLIGASLKTGSCSECVLAYIMAHELGHVFLPEYSHAPTGLMQASWESHRLLEVPDFMPSQAQEMRFAAANAR